MKEKIALFWFRRDLRLHDNVALFKALTSGLSVVPIFIFDPHILNKLPKNDARVAFIHEQLSLINQQLAKYQSSILVFHKDPLEAFKELCETYTIATVYTNEDYEPYALERDQTIHEFLKTTNTTFFSCKDQVIFAKDEIIKKDGTPYVVYTPYSRKWLETYASQEIQRFPSENHLKQVYPIQKNTLSTLEAMGFVAPLQKIEPYKVNSSLINQYEDTRNYPAIDATSKLGPHLRFGTVSIRDMVALANQQANKTFLKELIWREFFMQILWHFPHTSQACFKPKYERIEWRNNEADFKSWCEGKTGYPLVDAGMRQLNKTGFMHNRIRMLVGSFLCKHLLIDWRWGEAYFAEKLHDYEMASNVGNWQWVAGCGVDAAPYFRIFNPTTQIKKFDKELDYIKKWVPDLQELTYPKEMVEHKLARERCLKTYKEALT